MVPSRPLEPKRVQPSKIPNPHGLYGRSPHRNKRRRKRIHLGLEHLAGFFTCVQAVLEAFTEAFIILIHTATMDIDRFKETMSSDSKTPPAQLRSQNPPVQKLNLVLFGLWLVGNRTWQHGTRDMGTGDLWQRHAHTL